MLKVYSCLFYNSFTEILICPPIKFEMIDFITSYYWEIISEKQLKKTKTKKKIIIIFDFSLILKIEMIYKMLTEILDLHVD